jgi:hypothetical protein
LKTAPKTATATERDMEMNIHKRKAARVKIHWYVYAEWAFVAFEVNWVLQYFRAGYFPAMTLCVYELLCVGALLLFYGDDCGKDVYSRTAQLLCAAE